MKRKLFLPALMLGFLCSIFMAKAQDDSKYIANLLPAGTVAPAFKLTTPDGKYVALADYKGKYVVLDFFASWCPDCRKEMPEVINIYNTYKDKNVVVIGISFDTDRAKWTDYITQAGLKYPQVSELKKWKETEINTLYKIQWIPTLYLIGKDGKVLYTSIHAAQINEKLKTQIK